MKKCNLKSVSSLSSMTLILILLSLIFSVGCEKDPVKTSSNGDVNGDGTINILVIGTSKSIKSGSEAFASDVITTELQSILVSDKEISFDINVVAEDIYQEKSVSTSIAGLSGVSNKMYYRHSLAQYYFWPDDRESRINNISGAGDVVWDYVVIGADPYIISTTPGFYSLGVNKLVSKIVEGGAIPLLLMPWAKPGSQLATIDHFEEYVYRTSDGAKESVATIPAGLAWEALASGKKDNSTIHPSPNGAYLAAASIYSHIFNRSAASSDYLFDDDIAETAFSTIVSESKQVHYSGDRSFISPYKPCEITDQVLNYNHTGSSTEDGILTGLSWVLSNTSIGLQFNGTPPINFNYGRANTNYEASKRYKIDPAQFDFSLGFPVQDGGSTGDLTMLYGIDKRSGGLNDTDLGVVHYMINNFELPYARAIPVRLLYAQMKEQDPQITAYSDPMHMHHHLNIAIGAFMYTLLTGNCDVGQEPANKYSDEWRCWLAHKVGYETAWNLMWIEMAD